MRVRIENAPGTPMVTLWLPEGVQLTKHRIIVGGQPRPSEDLLAASSWKTTIPTSGVRVGDAYRAGARSEPEGVPYESVFLTRRLSARYRLC